MIKRRLSLEDIGIDSSSFNRALGRSIARVAQREDKDRVYFSSRLHLASVMVINDYHYR